MNVKSLILSAAAVFMLNGCTGLLWEQEGLVAGSRGMTHKEQKITVKKAGTDQIRAFAKTNATSKTLPPNRLLMMGDEYWYLVDEDDSKALVPVLGSKLSQRFTISQIHPKTGKSVNKIKELHVGIEKGKFTIDRLCLNYSISPNLPDSEQRREQNMLEQQSFEHDGNNYQRCFGQVWGQVYNKPDNLPAEYQFEQSIPVQLYTVSRKDVKKVNGKIVARNIALTPLTLAGDIVMFPLYVVLLISEL